MSLREFKNIKDTLCKASLTSFSSSLGVRNRSILDVSFSNGRTLSSIIVAINNEQIGSATFQPKFCMSKDEMITPTLPRVSANTCRKTPEMEMLQHS